MGDYVRWTGLWTLHGSIHGLGFRSLPGYETIDFGCGIDAGEGGDQLALKDATSDSIGYLGGRIRCFIRGGEGSYIFETSAGVHGTVDEGRCSELFEDNEGAIKLATNKHASRRTKHIDAKHHLVRDTSDVRKVRVAYVRSEDQHTDLLTKPLDMQTFYKHAKLIPDVV